MRSIHIKNLLFIAGFAAFIAAAVFAYNILTRNADADSEEASSDSAVNYIELEGSYAPDFTVIDADGNEVRFADMDRKITVINIWASWCGPCQSEMYDFQSIYDKYGDKVNVMMVNLTDGTRETLDSAKTYIDEHNLTFPVYFDTEGSCAKAYSVYNIPCTYIIDEEGRLAGEILGAANSGTIEEQLENMLA